MDVWYVALFCFFGVSSLLPWNAVISSTEYYDDRFKGTFLERSYESIFLMANNIVNLALNLFFVLYPETLSDFGLLVYGYILTGGTFVAFILLIFVFDITIKLFLAFTILLILVNALVSGLVLIGLSRIMSKHVKSGLAITSMNIGQALSGIIVSLVNYIIQKDSPSEIAFIEFCIALIVLFASLGLFLIYRKYVMKFQTVTVDNEQPLLQLSATKERKMQIEVIRSSGNLLLSLIVNFVINTSVYPSLTNLLTPTIVATCLLVYNVSDFIGRLVTFKFFLKSDRIILMLSLSRFVMVLFFLDLVYGPDRSYYVELTMATLLHALLGMSNGFLCANAFIVVAQKFLIDSEIDVAATSATLCIGIGLTLGSIVSMLFIE